MPISSPNAMFNHLLELSYQNDSNKWLNIAFGEEKMQTVLIVVNFSNLIWSSDILNKLLRILLSVLNREQRKFYNSATV